MGRRMIVETGCGSHGSWVLAFLMLSACSGSDSFTESAADEVFMPDAAGGGPPQGIATRPDGPDVDARPGSGGSREESIDVASISTAGNGEPAQGMDSPSEGSTGVDWAAESDDRGAVQGPAVDPTGPDQEPVGVASPADPDAPAPDGSTQPTPMGSAGTGECAAGQPCPEPDQTCQGSGCPAPPPPPPPPPSPPSQREVLVQGSAWNSRAGWVDERDRTHFCTPEVAAADRGPARVTSRIERVLSDGTREGTVREPQVSQRLRIQCQRDAASSGSAVRVTGSWSTDEEGDVVAVECPTEFPYLAFAHCQVTTTGVPSYVYAGTACGDGIAGLGAQAELQGQMLGARYELTTADTPKPLFNDTSAAGVIGTDLGYQFLAQGRLHIGFGDTWENELMLPGPLGLRGSVLAYTRDFDPTDGIVFEGWEGMPDNPQAAREVIPSRHGILGLQEYTAIATTGVGVTDGDTSYRFLWFAAIRDWEPFESIESTLAWSIDGGDFIRGDQAPDYHPPRWPHASYFGPGAMWFDREHGMIYLFAVRTYVPEMPIRLARVRATPDALRDHLQYEYWTGSEWKHPDPADEYALSRLDDPAADLIPGSTVQSNRPEISVAYNAFAGRYVMMLQNDLASFRSEQVSDFQLWQAKELTGPWSKVEVGDRLRLPGELYGPYTSDHLLTAGGEDMYFMLSEWNLMTLLAGQPYSVGLWRAEIQRNIAPGCLPD